MRDGIDGDIVIRDGPGVWGVGLPGLMSPAIGIACRMSRRAMLIRERWIVSGVVLAALRFIREGRVRIAELDDRMCRLIMLSAHASKGMLFSRGVAYELEVRRRVWLVRIFVGVPQFRQAPVTRFDESLIGGRRDFEDGIIIVEIATGLHNK